MKVVVSRWYTEDMEAMKSKTKTNRHIEDIARDATVGRGNDSEEVDFAALRIDLGRLPTEDEKRIYENAWARCLQEMAQP